MSKKTFLAGGFAVLLTFGGLAGCGDGVDQDNGVNDGEKKDAVDTGTVKGAEDAYNKAKDNVKDNLKEAEKNISDELNKNGVGDGVDQDNGISDGEKKDQLDSTTP